MGEINAGPAPLFGPVLNPLTRRSKQTCGKEHQRDNQEAVGDQVSPTLGDEIGRQRLRYA
jgi:hypothetical protein